MALLRRIEYQAGRLAMNPYLGRTPKLARSLIIGKSVDLLGAIIKFLNSALLYFTQNYAREYILRKPD
jgi:hypothetical protein